MINDPIGTIYFLILAAVLFGAGFLSGYLYKEGKK